MQVTLTPHAEELVQTAVARGLARSAEEAIEHALETMVAEVSSAEDEQERRRKAINGILEFQKKYQLKLGPDETIQDLINEGRRY